MGELTLKKSDERVRCSVPTAVHGHSVSRLEVPSHQILSDL